MEQWAEGRLVERVDWTDELFSLRIDAEIEPFKAGQFNRLAMEIDGRVVARPYSFVNSPTQHPLEFYMVRVPEGPLSNRLAALQPGDPVLVGRKGRGLFTLDTVADAPELWLLSTGTALGVFLSILHTEEVWRRFRRIVLVHAVRRVEELTYQDQLLELEARNPEQFQRVQFVSREETDFALHGRIAPAIEDGRLQERTGLTLTPENAQLMLCGNPDMVKDTMAYLEGRGFRRNTRKEPGNITTERYW